MDFSKLIRDPARVKKGLTETEDKQLIALRECKIYFPVRFEEQGLASVGAETHVVGHYMLVMEDSYYSVCNVNAMMEITPTSTSIVKVNEEDYYEFFFDKGSVIIPNTMLVKKDTLTYSIFNEIQQKGQIPFYMNYLDVGHLFDTADYHANAKVGKTQECNEIITSLIYRDRKERQRYYRQVVKSFDDFKSNPPLVIPLKSVQGATNTTNKIAGSYMNDGLNSALANPSTRTERIENILRK